MLITTRAIIFRTIKYQETSLIVEAYTELKGLRKYIISGVRKSKARTPASLLQVINLVELTAYDRDDRDLNRIKEVRLAVPYQQMPFDVIRGTLGLFMTEIARKTVKEREDNKPLFNFLWDNFTFLDESKASLANLPLQYLLELSTYLGIMPSGEWSAETPFFDVREGQFINALPGHGEYLREEKSLIVHRLLHLDRSSAHQMSIPKVIRLSLLDDLIRYYETHLEGMGKINSAKILRACFS